MPWPFGSVDREKTTLALTELARRAKATVSIDFILTRVLCVDVVELDGESEADDGYCVKWVGGLQPLFIQG
jgi:hypothetical protein